MRRLIPLVASVSLICSGCWAEAGFDPQHRSYNPTETAIDSSTWPALQQAWTAAMPNPAFSPSGAVVMKGIAYVNGHDGILRAYDAAGRTGCSGVPTTCVPLWTASAGGPASSRLPASDPAVDALRVFVGGADGKLYVFDADGKTGCSSATPRVCTPLWTATLGGAVFSPTISGRRLYVGNSNGGLFALDERGSQNCAGTPRVCTPLWSATTDVAYNLGVLQTPAVSGSRAFYPGSTSLFSYDAAGHEQCSGTPVVCPPLWRGDLGENTVGYPVVAGAIVYQALQNGDVAAFDAAGVVGCTGAKPAVCAPRWTDHTGNSILFGGPAVGPDGTAYLTGTSLTSFSSDGKTGCSGTPVVCLPLHKADIPNGLALPAVVVNDIVVMTILTNATVLAAFHTGTLAPLTTYSGGPQAPNFPVVDAGTVFYADSNGLLHAWRPKT